MWQKISMDSFCERIKKYKNHERTAYICSGIACEQCPISESCPIKFNMLTKNEKIMEIVDEYIQAKEKIEFLEGL